MNEIPDEEYAAAAPQVGESAMEPSEPSEDRRQGWGLVMIGAVVVALFAAAVLALTVGSDDGDETGELVEGTITTPTGETVDLADLRGQPVVMNFFASWCAPCREELPAFESVSEDLEGKVTIVGINSGETNEAAARELLEETGVTFLVGLGDDGTILADVGGTVMPTTALVDEDGRLVFKHPGDLTADELTALIEQELF